MSRVMTDLLRWLTLDTHNIDKHMLLTAEAHLLAEVDYQLLQANKFPQIIPYRSEITYAAVCKRLTTDTVRGPHWHHMLMTPTDSGRGNKYAKTQGKESGLYPVACRSKAGGRRRVRRLVRWTRLPGIRPHWRICAEHAWNVSISSWSMTGTSCA